jgi:hypothetical protein
MSSILRGTGKRLYGQRGFLRDRSYLTTEFFCVMYLPLFAIRTVRVIPDPKNSSLPFGRERYKLIAIHKPYFPQVLAVYQCAAATVILGFIFFYFVEPYLKTRVPVLGDEWIEPFVFCLWIAQPWMVARWLRSNARQQVIQNSIDPNDPTPIC